MTIESTLLARVLDPSTSHEAVPPRERRELQKRALLSLLADVGPMTDEELGAQYFSRRADRGWPDTQADSVRKRRAELANEGAVFDTGGRVPGSSGRMRIVWAAVRDEDGS